MWVEGGVTAEVLADRLAKFTQFVMVNYVVNLIYIIYHNTEQQGV